MKRLLTLTGIAISTFCNAQKVEIITSESEKKAEILIDGKSFTSYIFPGPKVLKKAVLYPIRTAEETLITRGWPLEPRPGDRVDHPHHVGLWLNYENVNGNDFWNNSNTPPDPKRAYGTIIHTGIKSVSSKNNEGELSVTADWRQDKDGKILIKEATTYHFTALGKQRIIDLTTTLTAVEDVTMPDVKDGMLAIRVARELELPSNKPDVFTDANGVATTVPKLDNTGVTGNYRNKEGIEGDSAWAKRSAWCKLTGRIKMEDITIGIIDHPKNIGYPTYWHARGYGLFAANPLGQKAFSNGKETLNYSLKKGQSTTFRYRIVIDSKILSDEEMNSLTQQFASKN